MKKVIGYLAVIMAVVVATGFLVYQSTAPSVVSAEDGRPHAQLDLIITVPDGTDAPLKMTLDLVTKGLANGKYQIDSFFDVSYVSNIGSSGEDGVSLSVSNIGSSGEDGVRRGGNFDVFFEVDYKKAKKGTTIETEMVALSLSYNPGPDPLGAIDAVKKAVDAGGGRVFYGHVTVLK